MNPLLAIGDDHRGGRRGDDTHHVSVCDSPVGGDGIIDPQPSEYI